MDKSVLNPETLSVESFDTGSAGELAMVDDGFKCTGCPSGCGIFPEP